MWESFKSSGKHEYKARCYESHPAIKIGNGTLYGGSCQYPKVTNADFYVALQRGDSCGLSSDPWEPEKVIEIHYSITDMCAPTDVPRFKKMITFLCNQLQAGRSVHVGCIGGHGRTGTVLSAIVAQMLEEKDAIAWVRKHYCKKAVESKEQVKFLMQHYGVKKATGYKEGMITTGGTQRSLGFTMAEALTPKAPNKPKLVESTSSKAYRTIRVIPPDDVDPQSRVFAPMASHRNVWRRKG